MRHDEDRLQDVIAAIDAILRRFPPGGRAEFDADELLRVWCLHHLTVIGEATAKLSEEIRSRHPSCPWRQVIGMRNAIVHGYFGVSWDEVWNALVRDVGPLRAAVEEVLRDEGWKRS
jgi:uncharacterized protein with HEPN domain